MYIMKGNAMKTKQYILGLVLGIMTAELEAQTPHWVQQMGGKGVENGTAIAVDGFSNVYTAGTFSGTADFDPGPDTFNMTTAGAADVFITKLDASGRFIWAKQFKGSGEDYVSAIAVDEDGNVYTTGHFVDTVDFDPGEGQNILISTGRADAFISKLDANGNHIWVGKFGGTNNVRSNALALDGSGYLYIAGEFEGGADFDPGVTGYFAFSAGALDAFITKLDTAGKFVWVKKMGGLSNDQPYSIVLDKTGNMHLAGTFYGTTQLNPGFGTYNLTSAGGKDIFIVKLDNTGSFLWARQMGGQMDDQVFSMALDASDNIYTSGRFFHKADFDPGMNTLILTSAGSSDAFISKLDTSGNLTWVKQVGGVGEDAVYKIALDTEAAVYTIGIFNESVTFDSGKSRINLQTAGATDVFVCKFDAAGELHWAYSMGGEGHDRGMDIALDRSGNIHTTGSFNVTADFAPKSGKRNLIAAGEADVFILKWNQITLGLQANSINTHLSAFPNPTNGPLTLTGKDPFRNPTLTVRNIHGQEVFHKSYSATDRIELNLDVPAGLYIAELLDGRQKATIKLIKQ
jgi:hypothetical protein